MENNAERRCSTEVLDKANSHMEMCYYNTWTKEEEKLFYQDAGLGYKRLQEELGKDYSIEYCEEKKK